MKNLSKKIKTYAPLIIIIAIIVAFVVMRQVVNGYCLKTMMHDFMGVTFMVFGFVKALNWRGFVESFRMYDSIAKRSKLFAYAYPAIEMGLGYLYFMKLYPIYTNIFTIVLVSVGTVSVVRELRKNNPFPCACLGAVFVLPMTWVTLFENVFMLIMASALLYMYL